MVFTRNSQIWTLNPDGMGAHQLSDPPRAGEWGKANLPFGDYDPRISPDGLSIVFERMVDDRSPHGNYDLFLININGTNLIKLTDSGYTQGLAEWSHTGRRIAYIDTAVNEVGQYDLYLTDPEGNDHKNITPSYFPETFLIHRANFSVADTHIYFIGEWWSE
jgi:Tol biopolymer transport system component